VLELSAQRLSLADWLISVHTALCERVDLDQRGCDLRYLWGWEVGGFSWFPILILAVSIHQAINVVCCMC
jgi:hypothetical protein